MTLLTGDCRDVLKTLPPGSVQCCVTSPPFFRQRDFGNIMQTGQEDDPAGFADALVAVFRLVKTVLRDDGSLWIELGDTYAAGGNGGGGSLVAKRRQWTGARLRKGWRRPPPGYKVKDLLLTPFMVADRLRADGWYLRSTVIWDKLVATEPPRADRPSTAHSYIFLLSKSEHYRVSDGGESWFRSTVWSLRPQMSNIEHPALLLPEIARRCIVASTGIGDVVIDPSAGAGTVGLVADRLGRDAILIELNPDYSGMARRRIASDAGMFARLA